jgi:hypothetical protein
MGTAKTKKAEVAVLSGASVPEIITKLESKIKELDHITDSKYKTSGKLDGFGNVKEETSIGNLIKAFSSVSARAKAYAEAAEALSIETFPVFELNGGTVEDWKTDIQLRIAIIQHKETLDKLQSYRDKMKEFLSKEDQKALLLEEMASFLSK